MRKICAECKYYQKLTCDIGTYYYCRHPELTDIVSNKATYCAINRNDESKCGAGGKYFEQKPPKPPRKPWFSAFRFRLMKED